MIFVTGGTGNVGREVVALLRDRHLEFRCGARAPANVHGDAGGMAGANGAAGATRQAVPFDFLDATTYGPAVEGCSAVFLLRPPAISNTRETLNVFVDVARRHGVSQVVFVSVAGAGSNPVVPHHAVEQHLKAGPAGWTVLRPGFFAQNFGDAYRNDIRRDNRLHVPAGTGRVAFVDVRDVAEVAVNALADPAAHRQRTYTLTGPMAHTFSEAARLLSAALGRPINYEPASIAGYALHLKRQGLPAKKILVQTLLHVGLRFGQAQAVDATLPGLLGHPCRTLGDYIRDHRDLWL